MPTYDYECKKCGHIFEMFQAISEEPLRECPKCGAEVRRLIGGGAGIIFKGSGFYVTDNPKSGSDKKKRSSSSSEGKQESSNSDNTAASSKKTDAKEASSASSGS